MKNTESSSNGIPQPSNSALNLPLTIEEIYCDVYGATNIQEQEKILSSLTPQKGVCGKSMAKGSIAYFCPKCAKDPASILCQECYDKSNHEGHHSYQKRGIGGGTCDCGDPESWEIEGSCSLHQAGFGDENSHPPALLPATMRENAINKVTNYMKILNQLCLYEEVLIEKLLKRNDESTDHTPGDVAIECRNNANKIMLIVEALHHLASTVSTIFLHMIASHFRSYSLDCKTTHQCHIRRFDDEKEEEHFHKMCAGKAVGETKGKGEEHWCTCTIIENFMRVHHMLGMEEHQEKLLYDFFVALLKNRRLKWYIGISYFANYASIIPNFCINYGLSLHHFSVQFVGYVDVSETVLRTPEYTTNILMQLNRILGEVKKGFHERKLFMDTYSDQIAAICTDIKYLLNDKVMHLLHPLMANIIRCISNFQHVDCYYKGDPIIEGIMKSGNKDTIEKFKADTVTLYYIQYQMFICFSNLLSTIDFSNSVLCNYIGKAFKESFVESFKSRPKEDSGCAIILLHRCFSFFLVNTLAVNFWLSPTKKSLINVKRAFTKMLAELLDFKAEPDLFAFLEDVLQGVLRAIGFNAELENDDWPSVPGFVEKGMFPRTLDLSLVYAIISILPKKPDWICWVAKRMHPGAKDLQFVLGRLVKGNSTPQENILPMSSLEPLIAESGHTHAKLQALINNVFHIICLSVAKHNIYYFPIAAHQKMPMVKNLEGMKKAKGWMSEYFDYSINTKLIHACVFNYENMTLTHANLKDLFIEEVRDLNRVEQCLEEITTPSMDPIARVYKFRLKEDHFAKWLPYCDPYFYLDIKQFTKVFQKSLSVMKKVSSPYIFDFAFGELNSENRGVKKDTEEPFLPFIGLMQEQFLSSDVPVMAESIIKHCALTSGHATDPVTPYLLRASFKILLNLRKQIKGSEKDRAWLGLMKVNLEKLPIFYDGNEILAEKYLKVLTDLGENKDLGKELLSEEIKDMPLPDLKRKESKEFKECKQKFEEKAAQVRAEFKKKKEIFAKKNDSALKAMGEKTGEKAQVVCTYCLGAVEPGNFGVEPYGRIGYIQKSKVWWVYEFPIVFQLSLSIVLLVLFYQYTFHYSRYLAYPHFISS